jgi:hypothetical protein
MPHSRCRSLNRSFLSLADVLPAVPLAVSLVSHRSTSCPPRRSLNRLFLSIFDALPAAPLAVSLVFLTGQPLAPGAAS